VKRLLGRLVLGAGGLLMVLVLLLGGAVWYASKTVSAQPGSFGCCLLPATPGAAGTFGAGDGVGSSIDYTQVDYLELATGQARSLTEGSAGPRLLVFFASWCASCAEEAPTLLRLAEEGVSIRMLSTTDTLADARAWIEKYAPILPAGVLLKGGASALGIYQLPTIVLLDDAGGEVRRWRGSVQRGALRESWAMVSAL